MLQGYNKAAIYIKTSHLRNRGLVMAFATSKEQLVDRFYLHTSFQTQIMSEATFIHPPSPFPHIAGGNLGEIG